MTLRRPNLVMALGVALSVASAAHAGDVPINKGKVAKKAPAATCAAALQSNDATTITTVGKKTVIQCTDGSACDGDNTKNGTCTFGIKVCTAAAIDGCTAEPVTSI